MITVKNSNQVFIGSRIRMYDRMSDAYDLRTYFDKTKFTAKFLKNNNVLSEDIAKVSVIEFTPIGKRLFKISIADGNHDKTFDEIDIVSETNECLFKLYISYEQYIKDTSTGFIQTLVEIN